MQGVGFRPFVHGLAREPRVREQPAEDLLMDVLWITAGLSCDGDTIAITAATQPSIEDLVLGGIPGVPAGHAAQPASSPTRTATSSCEIFHRAADGELDPFILVVEGSIPNEKNKAEGFWAGVRHRPGDRPADPDVRLDRPAGAAGLGRRRGRDLRDLRRHPRDGRQPDRLHGPGRLPRLGLAVDRRACPIVCVPGCPVQPDNFMEMLLYLLRQAAGTAPMIPLDDAAAADAGCSADTVHEGCDRGGYYEQADFAAEYGSRKCIVKLGCWGPVVQCNVGKRGWMDGIGGCPNVGGICIGCTMPGFPDKFMPFMDEPPGAQAVDRRPSLMYGRTVRALRNFTQSVAEQRAGLAAAGDRPAATEASLSTS